MSRQQELSPAVMVQHHKPAPGTVITRFEREADSIERVFATLAVPLRVQGGEMNGDRVRYHLSPGSVGLDAQVEGVLGQLAAVLGSPSVRLAREPSGLALEVERSSSDTLALLPLLDLLGKLQPLHLPLGMTTRGTPLVLNLGSAASWHLLATGTAAGGKSELLRSVAVGLALNSPPAEVQILGIDATGQELALLEAIPHGMTDIALERAYAAELIDWLAAETARRRLLGARRPHLFLFVDDLQWLEAAGVEDFQERFRWLLEAGPQTGVHLIAAARSLKGEACLDPDRTKQLVHAQICDGSDRAPGAFTFTQGEKRVQAQVAWLPARDLDSAVRLIEAVWLGSADGSRVDLGEEIADASRDAMA